MLLSLTRTTLTKESYIGKLAVNGVFQCFTLERPTEGPIVCIPEGTYNVVMSYSQDFEQMMPHLVAVPNRTAIMIHWGNWARNSKGCILVGETASVDFVGSSRAAFAALLNKIEASPECQITIDSLPLT